MGSIVLTWKDIGSAIPIGWIVQSSPCFFKCSKSHAYQMKMKYICRRCKHEWVSPNGFVQFVIWEAEKHVNIFGQIFCQQCRTCKVFTEPCCSPQELLLPLQSMIELWHEDDEEDGVIATKRKKKLSKKKVQLEKDNDEQWSLSELNKTSERFDALHFEPLRLKSSASWPTTSSSYSSSTPPPSLHSTPSLNYNPTIVFPSSTPYVKKDSIDFGLYGKIENETKVPMSPLAAPFLYASDARQ